MPRKQGESKPPWEHDQPWAPGQTVRMLEAEGTEQQTLLVKLAVRSMPNLRFDVELNAQHLVVAVAVRPLVRVTEGIVLLVPEAVDDVPADAKPLTSRLLRDVPWGALAVAADREARKLGALARPAADSSWARTLKAEPVKPGRRSNRGDVFYAALAADYVRVLEEGDDEQRRRPAETLAGAPRFVSASSVSNLLRDARRRGLLTAAPSKGTAGGQLTDKARALLADHDQEEG